MPSAPVLRQQPPTSADWIHEVKFDGFRVQLHKDADEVIIFTRNGNDVWAFDLLREDETDLRPKPLWERKRALQRLILEANEHILRFSDDFDDPMKLLQVAEQWKLEGIVSKKLDQPYKSGRNFGWVKVKTQAWRKANKGRWELFQR